MSLMLSSQWGNQTQDANNSTFQYTPQQLKHFKKYACFRNRVRDLLDESGLEFMHFTYDYDPANSDFRNAKIHQAITEIVNSQGAIINSQSGVSDEVVTINNLVDRFKYAVENCPYPSECVIVPIHGRSHILQRMEVASTALSRIDESMGETNKKLNQLRLKNSELKRRINDLNNKNAYLKQRMLSVLNLMEQLALSEGTVEFNSKGAAMNDEILNALESRIKESNYQRRIDLLSIYQDSLEMNKEENEDNDELSRDNTAAFKGILSSRTEVIEELIEGLHSSSIMIQRMQNAIRSPRA